MKLSLQKFVILYLCVTHSHANVNFTNTLHTDEQIPDDLMEKYTGMEKTFKDLSRKAMKVFLPFIVENSSKMNLSNTCINNLLHVAAGLRRLDVWALRFIDAMGKIPSGVLNSNLQMLGEYEYCLATTVMKHGKISFRGQYCLVEVKPYLPPVKEIPPLTERTKPFMTTANASHFLKAIAPYLSLFYYRQSSNIGVCVPSGCNEDEILQIVQNVVDSIHMKSEIAFCVKEGDSNYWPTSKICSWCLLVLLIMLVFLGTSMDYILKEKNEKYLVARILICFSLIKNFTKVISTKTTESSLTSFNGLRSLSTMWVVLSHEYLFVSVLDLAGHPKNAEKVVPKFFPQIIFNGTFCVDTFFFISGFLNSYIRMKIKESGKSQPSFLMMIVHRLWRLYPALIVAHIVLYMVNMTTPESYKIRKFSYENCERFWWRSFLFLNNVFRSEDRCMPQTWYVSADMQLFLFSLITVPILLRNPKKGVILHFGLVALALISTTVIWWVNEYPPTFQANVLSERHMHHMVRIFSTPLVHLGPYYIGILLGYFFATGKRVEVSKKVQVVGWMMSTLLCTFTIFISQRWNSGTEYTRLGSSLYGGFSRTLFALGIAWVACCCISGSGGVVNYILSLKMWFPISRISYMTYLISPMIQVYFHLSVSSPVDLFHMDIVWAFFGNLCVSLIASLILALLIESPSISMEKILFNRGGVQKKAATNGKSEVTQNVEMKTNNPS